MSDEISAHVERFERSLEPTRGEVLDGDVRAMMAAFGMSYDEALKALQLVMAGGFDDHGRDGTRPITICGTGYPRRNINFGGHLRHSQGQSIQGRQPHAIVLDEAVEFPADTTLLSRSNRDSLLASQMAIPTFKVGAS